MVLRKKRVMGRCLWGLAALVVMGCQDRLEDDRQVHLEVGEIQTYALPVFASEQTIRVEATSPGAPITVHVYLVEDEEAVERKITLGKPPEKLLAVGENAEKVALTAKVAADKAAIVRLQPAARQAVDVHLTIRN